MAYVLFEKGLNIRASDMNNNFEHVGSGDLLPRSGTYLSATSASLDLGESDNEWKTLYGVNAVMASGTSLNNCWNLLTEIVLSATASSIEVTGLLGDAHLIYWIMFKPVFLLTATVRLYPNSDSSASYSRSGINGSSSALAILNADDEIGMWLDDAGHETATAEFGFIQGFLHARTGLPRSFIRTSGKRYTSIDAINIWQDSSATITSLKFVSTVANAFGTGSTLYIWGGTRT